MIGKPSVELCACTVSYHLEPNGRGGMIAVLDDELPSLMTMAFGVCERCGKPYCDLANWGRPMSRDDEERAERAQDYVFHRAAHYLQTVDRHILFGRRPMEDAWPPTGELDHRPAGRLGVSRGELSSLALAFGGNRPDPGLTTAQRAERALKARWSGRDFKVYERPEINSYEIHRIK